MPRASPLLLSAHAVSSPRAVNLVLDPLFIFRSRVGFGLGVAGAALATALSEALACALYLVLLLRRRLASWGRLLRPPDLSTLVPLLRGSSANLVRTALWNGWDKIKFVFESNAAGGTVGGLFIRHTEDAPFEATWTAGPVAQFGLYLPHPESPAHVGGEKMIIGVRTEADEMSCSVRDSAAA